MILILFSMLALQAMTMNAMQYMPMMNPQESIFGARSVAPNFSGYPIPFSQQQQQSSSFPLSASIPLSSRKRRKHVAWLEYLSTIFMDVGAEWAVTDLNRDISHEYHENAMIKPARFFHSMLNKISKKAERFKVRIKRAVGLGGRSKELFLELKAGHVTGAYRKLFRSHFQRDQTEDLLKMILATRMIVIDSLNPRSILRLWSPSFGLNIMQKLQVLDYYENMQTSRCPNDIPPLMGIPFADAIRLRILVNLNRPLDPLLMRPLDASQDEVAMARLGAAYGAGELCAAGSVRDAFKPCFTVPRLPNMHDSLQEQPTCVKEIWYGETTTTIARLREPAELCQWPCYYLKAVRNPLELK